ncbi:QWRF motif-containing protein 3 [Cucurbita moschata]|uniref:QWRF motif-containing protein 3 n=1 Tax=Cucurbita moschata TaxID=3662 RepID=A0A6J1FUT4_CUCMO|nr:QWRF motif-containing protein 3 [Cucurbita moschata]
MKNVNESLVSDQLHRPRRPKSREVSSRFLSPASVTDAAAPSSSPTQPLSPTHRKSRFSSFDARKHRSQDGSLFVHGLWPSSKRFDTLADHLGNERFKDEKPTGSNGIPFVDKQRDSRELSNLESEKECAKENDKPIIGGSLRYCGKIQGKYVSSSSSKLPVQSSESGRLSVDENALFGRSSRRRSENFKNSFDLDPDGSPTMLGKMPTIICRRAGIMVPSKYMNDVPSRRLQRGSSDSSVPNPVSLESSPTAKKTHGKTPIQRSNSISGHGSSTSQWALSPGRSGSPPMSVESKEKPMSFSSLKPVRTPSKAATGMEKLLNLGLDLFKSRKSSISITSPIGFAVSDSVHQLRVFHNRLVQWRFANARARSASVNLASLAEKNLTIACYDIAILQQSVQQKKLQLQKEKLQFKLNFIVHSQLKPLESWGGMERQHLAAVSMTKDCLHSVICRVPLIEGAKIDGETMSMALRQACDLLASMKSMISGHAPRAKETACLLSDLAKVVIQERLVLEEVFELHKAISVLEMEERSLKCGIIQMKTEQYHHHHHHHHLQQLQEQGEEASRV